MKRKSIYVLLMIAVFAVVSLGGCGGSNDSFSVGDTNTSPSMSEVWQDEEAAQEIVSKLSSEDVLMMMTVRMEKIEKNSDGSVTMKYYNVGEAVVRDSDYPEVPYNAAEVLARYNSGDVIVLMNTDINLVNRVRADLGLVSEDAGNFGESGILEAYGISCQKVDGLSNIFVYVVPNYGDLIASNDTVIATQELEANDNPEDLPDAQNTSPDKAEIIAEPYTLRDFQINRWVNFLKWMGNLGVMALRNSAAASAYTVMAAANTDLTTISRAQSYQFDFSYTRSNSSVYFSDYRFTYSTSRNSYVDVTIYSAHSFTSGKDYYLVESNTSTVPKNFSDIVRDFDAGGHGYRRNILYGFTRSTSTEFNIDGGGMGNSDVALIRNAPQSLNSQTSYTEGMDWGLNGSIGATKDGPSAEVGGSVNFSKSKSWTVAEYSLTNDCFKEHPASAKWYVDVQKPGGGSNHYVRAFVYWHGVNAVGSSTRTLSYESYFMWEVSKNYWQNHPKISLNVNFEVKDGICAGWCTSFYGTFERFDESESWHDTKSLTLLQPPHTGVNKAHISLTAHASDQESFIVYAEDSWTIKDIPSWLHLTDTSGSATGDTGKLIGFDVDANTTGSPRSATFVISSGRDNIEVQITQSRNN